MLRSHRSVLLEEPQFADPLSGQMFQDAKEGIADEGFPDLGAQPGVALPAAAHEGLGAPAAVGVAQSEAAPASAPFPPPPVLGRELSSSVRGTPPETPQRSPLRRGDSGGTVGQDAPEFRPGQLV